MKSAASEAIVSASDHEIFKVLMENVSDAVFVIEPRTLRVLDANREAAARLGYSTEEISAARADHIFPECADLLRDSADGDASVTQNRLLAKDGRSVACALTVRQIRGLTRPVALLIAREIERDACPERRSVAEGAVGACRVDLIETNFNFPSIIGQSAQIREVCRLIGLVAQTEATVLIQGESGTGKELVAQAVHFHSRRCGRPLIKVNCAALTETLLESELFGHKKGAFTGAIQDRKGRFKLADGGTIILDEIDSLSLPGQAKLLRVLQEKEFEPVGDSTTMRVDVRVVAITNADLTRSIDEGRFREDLYYRLNAFPIRLPPLRERREDISLLVRHFLQGYSSSLRKQIVDIDVDALSLIMDYAWPGNVRELENTVEYAVILEKGRLLGVGSLPDKLRREPEPDRSLKRRLEIAERQIILEALLATKGVKNRAATLLGIDRRNFSYFLNKHGIG
ncbi:MAG TPA: sigma 54-interacting transcriptional regulator [Blastocatellia bacterium]|jgi:Transcriptional regulator containing PAS, AAA-type ATPase, and DNA-binding domains